ncbi:hypothetical protein JOS77_07660 [Chromobacterium haemolyticum]|nr:hypothetical protein JOS77_07660 [Chromobacterium haemolyticum]
MPILSPHPANQELIRHLAEQAFSRSAGAPLVGGNHLELLYDSVENFPAWEQAIADSRESVFIEMYIFANDAFGLRIRDLLTERARAGVKVCVLYDWAGQLENASGQFLHPAAGSGSGTALLQSAIADRRPQHAGPQSSQIDRD